MGWGMYIPNTGIQTLPFIAIYNVLILVQCLSGWIKAIVCGLLSDVL